jgi:hypothetical protein
MGRTVSLRYRRVPVHAAWIIGTVVLAGCHPATALPDGAASPSGAARPRVAAPAGEPPCVVGAWRSDGFTVDTTLAAATGGGGFAMTVDPAGHTVVDFAGMHPVAVKVELNGSTITSHLKYTGRVTGRLHLPAATASTGPWESDPDVDWSSLRVTIDIDGSKIFDNASPVDIAKEMASAGTTPKSDTQPVLGAGTYTCAGDKLTVTQQGGSASAVWTLHRQPS